MYSICVRNECNSGEDIFQALAKPHIAGAKIIIINTKNFQTFWQASSKPPYSSIVKLFVIFMLVFCSNSWAKQCTEQ